LHLHLEKYVNKLQDKPFEGTLSVLFKEMLNARQLARDFQISK